MEIAPKSTTDETGALLKPLDPIARALTIKMLIMNESAS